jgi:hypothetical protein
MKLNGHVLTSDFQAQSTLKIFTEIRSLGTDKKLTLLELMERFRNARCINPRDKVFALRGIAADGDRLSPRYDEPVGEAYFRFLSTLPTERVMPKMTGYRWPHEAADRLQSSMQLKKQDIFNSLVDCTIDRLYATFEYIGYISKVHRSLHKRKEADSADPFSSFSLELELSRAHYEIFPGIGNLEDGDFVYSLQSTSNSPRGLYIAFRPGGVDKGAVGMLIQKPDSIVKQYWANMGLYGKDIQLISDVLVRGVVKCSHNTSPMLLKP